MSAPTVLVWSVGAAGLLHFSQVPAMLAMNRLLNWRDQLGTLEPVSRRIVRVIGLAIVLIMTGLGVVVTIAPADLCQRGLGMRLAGLLVLLLGLRSWVQWRVYGPLWPRSGRAYALHLVLGWMFSLQTLVYLAAFLHAVLSGSAGL